MITEEEFLEIVHNHLKVDEDGCVFIEDKDSLDNYVAFLKQNAKHGKKSRFHINVACLQT